MTSLLAKIEARTAHVVVSGVGYVGLPLAVELARAGFFVTGLDTDAGRARALTSVGIERLRGTTDPGVLAEADAVLVCVPTPLKETREPDIRHIVEATEAIARHQHPGMLVVLESTTYPGTTAEVLVPRLTSRFALGEDVFVAYSPERVDPGNRTYGPQNTPKVIAGATPRCLELARALYGTIVDTLVPVSSTTTAEMVKVLENTFRAVNVGLVNEMAVMSRRLGIDPFEVVRAAATKPFGFMPFYPGPGVGGHCIPLDPLYLSWKLERLDYRARFIELADAMNRAMPEYVVGRVMEALNDAGKALRGSRVLVYGVAYKRDVADTRESPALAIIDGLALRGARVAYMDPFVPEFPTALGTLASRPPGTPFSEDDVVVIVTDHAALDRSRLLCEARLVVDTRDALAGCEGPRDHVHGL